MKKYLLCLGLVTSLFLAHPAFAATLTVTTTADVLDDTDGVCSLREAIINSNDNKTVYENCSPDGAYGTNTIVIPEGDLCLSLEDTSLGDENGGKTGDLDILDSVTISGAGADRTFVGLCETFSGQERVFHVAKGADTVPSVTFEGITIQNGKTGANGGGLLVDIDTTVVMKDVVFINNSSNNYGGAVYVNSAATFILQDSLVIQNSAKIGGGVTSRSTNSRTTLTSVLFSANEATESGGGLYVSDSSTVDVSESFFIYNTAGTNGGGFAVLSANLSAQNITVTENTAVENGGGAYLDFSTFVTLENSTFSENLASTNGGGLYVNYPAKLITKHLTIFGNQATEKGGGVYIDDNTEVTFENATIMNNLAQDQGGGFYIDQEVSAAKVLNKGTLSLKNTILAGNGSFTAGSSECYLTPVTEEYESENGYLGLLSYGFNLLSSDATLTNCAFNTLKGQDITTVSLTSLNIQSLADNGGLTQTAALLEGSPAIDAGDCDDIDGKPILKDQRGYYRPKTGCDIGAYELSGSATYTDADGDGEAKEFGDCDDTTTEINSTATEICADGVDNDCDDNIDESSCEVDDTVGNDSSTDGIDDSADSDDSDGSDDNTPLPSADESSSGGCSLTHYTTGDASFLLMLTAVLFGLVLFRQRKQSY